MAEGSDVGEIVNGCSLALATEIGLLTPGRQFGVENLLRNIQNFDRGVLNNLAETTHVASRCYYRLRWFTYTNYRDRKGEPITDGDAKELYDASRDCELKSGVRVANNGLILPEQFGEECLLLLERYLFEKDLITEKPYERLVGRKRSNG